MNDRLREALCYLHDNMPEDGCVGCWTALETVGKEVNKLRAALGAAPDSANTKAATSAPGDSDKDRPSARPEPSALGRTPRVSAAEVAPEESASGAHRPPDHEARARELLRAILAMWDVNEERPATELASVERILSYRSAATRDAERERDKYRKALDAINEIRSSIVGLQAINWSEHIYPLVAALNEAGIDGMAYPEAREYFGTMLERTVAAERERDEARAEAAQWQESSGQNYVRAQDAELALEKAERERDEALARVSELEAQQG